MLRTSLILALLTLSVPVLAQQSWSYINTLADVTVSGTAAAVFNPDDVNPVGHAQAQTATCSLTTANIRVTTDGSTPTSSYGEVLVPGNYVFSGTQVLLNLQAIRDDSTSGVLACTLYGK